MRHLPILTQLIGHADNMDHRPANHDDRRAADAALAGTRFGTGSVILDRVLPETLVRALARRREERMLKVAMARLADLSPHLLADVGMMPAADIVAMKPRAQQLADDVADNAAETAAPALPVVRRLRPASADVAPAAHPVAPAIAAE
jgi:hypothetical protein